MGGRGGEHRFTGGTFADTNAEGISPPNGMRLRFYCDDGDDLGRPDYLLFDGVIRQDAKGVWRSTVVDDSYWHECGERPLYPA
jgi:hypothetical protein